MLATSQLSLLLTNEVCHMMQLSIPKETRQELCNISGLSNKPRRKFCLSLEDIKGSVQGNLAN